MVRFIKKMGIVYLFIAGLVFYQSANAGLKVESEKAEETSPVIGCWHFDEFEKEGELMKTKDTSGNGNNATIYGTVPVKRGDGYALKFNPNDYVEIGGSPVFNTDKGALELWVRPVTNGDIFCYGHDTNAYIGMIRCSFNTSTNSFDLLAITRVGGVQHPYTWLLKNGDTQWSPRLPADKWYYVVLNHNGKLPQLYINGELQTYVEKSTDTDFSVWMDKYPNARTLIGRIPGQKEGPFEGMVDEVTIYNRPLSLEEIKAHYEKNKGGFGNEK